MDGLALLFIFAPTVFRVCGAAGYTKSSRSRFSFCRGFIDLELFIQQRCFNSEIAVFPGKQNDGWVIFPTSMCVPLLFFGHMGKSVGCHTLWLQPFVGDDGCWMKKWDFSGDPILYINMHLINMHTGSTSFHVYAWGLTADLWRKFWSLQGTFPSPGCSSTDDFCREAVW